MSQLIEYAKRSPEAEALFKDFAERKRVHTKVPVNITRLYHKLWDSGTKLDMQAFADVFQRLQEWGYGKVVINTKGYQLFESNIPISAIGKEAFPDYVPKVQPKQDIYTIPPANTQVTPLRRSNDSPGRVVVLFQVHGVRCKAEIPSEAVEEFAAKVGL